MNGAWPWLIAAMLFNAAANVCLKHSAVLTPPAAPDSDGLTRLWARLASPSGAFFVAGLVLFAANVVLYRRALEGVPVSVAYPVMAVGALVLVTGAGTALYGEALSWRQTAGLACVAAGMVLIAPAGRP